MNINELNNLSNEYSNKLRKEGISTDYSNFQEDEAYLTKRRNFYESFLSFSSKIIPFSFKVDSIDEAIDLSDIHGSSKEVVSATILTLIFFVLLSLPLLILDFVDYSFFFVLAGFFLSYVVYSYPKFKYQIVRIQAQQESLLAILYITIYLRVSPVLENAVFFSVQHLSGPLSKELKRSLWLLDMNKVANINQALSVFIPRWIKRNPDFVKSILILMSINNQPDETHQDRILNKALDYILSSTYEKMTKYSHNLKNPVNLINIFGMFLPLIGLIGFPLISVFLSDQIKVSYFFIGYIFILPMLLFVAMNRLIAKRPGAFSKPDLTRYIKDNHYFKFKLFNRTFKIKIILFALLISLIIAIPGLFDMFFNILPAYFSLRHQANPDISNIGWMFSSATMLKSLFIPLGFGLFFYLITYLYSYRVIKIRKAIEEIDNDLPETLFQLSNQFTENIPLEQAIINYLNEINILNLGKKYIFKFFNEVYLLMKNIGLTFENALFNKQFGVLLKYPSVLLKEIMWVIVEGSKKGSNVVYNVVTKICNYLDDVKKIENLIYSLLVDTTNAIKIQARFISPFISGIVGSLTLIVVKALYELSQRLEGILQALNFASNGIQSSTNFFSAFFNFAKITPPALFQVLVGIYMVQSVVLLSYLADGIEHGFDKTTLFYNVSKNLKMALIVYSITIFLGVLTMNSLMAPMSNI